MTSELKGGLSVLVIAALCGAAWVYVQCSSPPSAPPPTPATQLAHTPSTLADCFGVAPRGTDALDDNSQQNQQIVPTGDNDLYVAGPGCVWFIHRADATKIVLDQSSDALPLTLIASANGDAYAYRGNVSPFEEMEAEDAAYHGDTASYRRYAGGDVWFLHGPSATKVIFSGAGIGMDQLKTEIIRIGDVSYARQSKFTISTISGESHGTARLWLLDHDRAIEVVERSTGDATSPGSGR